MILQTLRTQATALVTTTKTKGHALWSGWRFKHDKAKLEKALANIIEVANGHQARKVATGSSVYVELYQQANLKIDTFCQTHHVHRTVIEREVPALRELEALTHPVSPSAGLARGVFALVAVAIGAVAFGIAGGFAALGYHWVTWLIR